MTKYSEIVQLKKNDKNALLLFLGLRKQLSNNMRTSSTLKHEIDELFYIFLLVIFAFLDPQTPSNLDPIWIQIRIRTTWIKSKKWQSEVSKQKQLEKMKQIYCNQV